EWAGGHKETHPVHDRRQPPLSILVRGSMSTSTPPALTESWLELPDGKLFWLKGRCSVGRHGDNDLVLDSPTVSRHHALLAAEVGGFAVSDLHSSNGTYVNRTPVTRVTPLHD